MMRTRSRPVILCADDFALARYNPNGSLDTSFSGDGKQTTDFGGFDQAKAVAIQGDGKIVAVLGRSPAWPELRQGHAVTVGPCARNKRTWSSSAPDWPVGKEKWHDHFRTLRVHSYFQSRTRRLQCEYRRPD